MVVLLVQVSTINREIGDIHALFKNWMSTRQYYNNHKKKSNHGNNNNYNNNYYLSLSLLLLFCRIYENKTSKMYIGKFNVDNRPNAKMAAKLIFFCLCVNQGN